MIGDQDRITKNDRRHGQGIEQRYQFQILGDKIFHAQAAEHKGTCNGAGENDLAGLSAAAEGTGNQARQTNQGKAKGRER